MLLIAQVKRRFGSKSVTSLGLKNLIILKFGPFLSAKAVILLGILELFITKKV